MKTPPNSWPSSNPSTYQGPAGRIVTAIAPHTEADPVALQVHILAEFSCTIGRRPHICLDGAQSPLSFWPVCVGESSKSRKGTADKRVKPVIQQAVPNWTRGECRGTLSSGEGLVNSVRDARGEDPGVPDKRLYLVQAEFGSVLKVMAREGNSLSGVIRDAWDGSDLAPMTKGDPIRATRPHIVIVGHVTKGELLKHLREEEAGNGFGNRFEYFAVRRSQILPFGGTPDPAVLGPLIEELRQGIAFASSVGEVGMTAEAKQGWIAVYPTLSEGKPGMVGALLARGEAHVRRAAALYALLDQQREVHTVHLDAALALWDFSEASALWIFGDNTGDAIADKILQSLRALGTLNETEVSSLFYKNVPAARLDLAKHLLLNLKLAHTETLATGGRPIVMWKPGPAPSV